MALRGTSKEGGEQLVTKKAFALGRRAEALGLNTLDMAGIHAKAWAACLAEVADPSASVKMRHQATEFFKSVLVPFEHNNPPAVLARSGLAKVRRVLKKRSQELAKSLERLRSGVSARKLAGDSLKLSEKKSRSLLEETTVIESRLEDLTQQLFTIQEKRRKQMSSQLHEEIAVTLLAIHVRLLALNKEAALNQHHLSQEIATANRLVEQSAKTMKQFNREFGIKHEP